MNAAGLSHAGKLPRVPLCTFALLFLTVLHFAERIIAGAVQCPGLEACPWH